MSLRLPPVSAQASGIPVASTSRWCLEPFLALSTGLGPVAAPPFRLHVAGVNHSSRPLDLARRTQPREQQLVQPIPDPGPLPRVQATPAGHTGAETNLDRHI